MSKKYKIKEIFGPTIEGEGGKAGAAVLFLRFSGCNRWSGREIDRKKSVCYFCDTDFVGGELLTAEKISSALLNLSTDFYNVKNVVITGGEPLLHLDLELLVELKKHEFNIYLETNGSVKIKPEMRPLIDHVAISPKQPFGETLQRECDDLKILFPFLKGVEPHKFSGMRAKNRFIQPIDGTPHLGENTEDAIQYIFKYGTFEREENSYKLSVQIHKVINMP